MFIGKYRYLAKVFLQMINWVQIPFILRDGVLNSSSGDGQKEDGSQGKRDVHGQGNSQLTT